MTLTSGLLLCLIGGMARDDDGFAAPFAVTYPLVAVSGAVLLARHRAPRAALVATAGCVVGALPFGLFLNPLLLAPFVIAAFHVGAHCERREGNVVMAATAALLLAATLVSVSSWQESSRVANVAFPLLAGALGRSLSDRRAYLAAVEDRAQRAEQSRESEARRRVAEERLRIARELHDVVAHHIALANAQAAVATQLFDSNPAQARRSLAQLSETTRDALNELRGTVGLLRRSSASPTPVEPAPGLSQLPQLIDSFQRAGLRVTLDSQGPARPLSPSVDLTAYRIIAEALTNVTKHAATASARVVLAYDASHLTLSIIDDGRPAAPSPDRPPGYGLIGMRERAAAAGGRLSAGRRPEGGFLVTAELPLPSPRDAHEPRES